ncbi:MAG TPA: lysozyme inhibitor LprI family protein [Geminicoccaceae bacterium]|nr:lysozyme inhibitor LprI family protein [Geminicoccus sp.]HMU51961.1 lysozyme inhibitor LprI family protein [Geminicoccaceae bacterium]
MISLSRFSPLLALLAAPPAWAAPSFDCAKAGGWVEHTVCAEAVLADLDSRLAGLYAARRHGLAAAEDSALRDSQRAWARGRAACEKQPDAVACLERHYRQRLAELADAAPPAWVGEVAGSLVAIDGCLAATPSTAVAVTDLRRDGGDVRLALRGGTGRGFACRVSLDGKGMVAVEDAEASPVGPGFRRGAASPCPSAAPVTSAVGATVGWITPASC